MTKLSSFREPEWIVHSHPPVFETTAMGDGVRKIVATAPGSDPLVLEELARCLTPPFYLLYLLHTPRGEGAAGRYQSGEVDQAALRGFMERFGRFLGNDGRHDFWVHSPADAATLVWDRHDLVHAYGPVDMLISKLRGLGFQEGTPSIPSPHAHNYRAEFDTDAAAMLAEFDWSWSPLQPGDEQ